MKMMVVNEYTKFYRVDTKAGCSSNALCKQLKMMVFIVCTKLCLFTEDLRQQIKDTVANRRHNGNGLDENRGVFAD